MSLRKEFFCTVKNPVLVTRKISIKNLKEVMSIFKIRKMAQAITNSSVERRIDLNRIDMESS
jgi:hypothetical protein